MTTATAEASRSAPAAPRLGFARRLIVIEAALTVAEAILVIGPTLALVDEPPETPASGRRESPNSQVTRSMETSSASAAIWASEV